MTRNYDNNKELDFFQIFGNKFKGSVLDIGCNEGIIGSKITCDKYLGLDIDNNALKIAKARGLKVKQFNADTDIIPKAETVLCLDIIEHLQDPLSFLERLRSSANDRVIISLPNDYSLSNFIRMFFFNRSIKFESDIGNPGGHIQFFTVKNSKDIISKYFYIKDVYYASSRFTNPFYPYLNKLLLKISPRLFASNIFIDCTSGGLIRK